MTLGERIKERRLKLDLTQDQLAEMMGVSRHVLSSYEADRNVPPGMSLGKIADALKVSVDYLLGRSDTPYEIYSNPDKQNFSTAEETLIREHLLELEELIRSTEGAINEKKLRKLMKMARLEFEEDLFEDRNKKQP